jgi:hypothetical protein
VFLDNLLTFIALGFRHILPLGLDHILFIAALSHAAKSWRRLLLEASAFTGAHTASLALAASGLVRPPETLTEALIALSVVAMGLDAARLNPSSASRLVVIVLFGLIHGLGFASVISGYLSGADFLTGLIGFNLGVELGQIVVIGAVLLLGSTVRAGLVAAGRSEAYGPFVIRPLALIIALAGLTQLMMRTLWAS